MDAAHVESATRLRTRLTREGLDPAAFRAALVSVPPADRDAWVDAVFEIDGCAGEDGPALPRGGVPYLPCSVDAILRMVDEAEVRDTDVFVDVGCGVGRAMALVQRLTGASAIGLEIQPQLVVAARDLARRAGLSGCSIVEGDAAELVPSTNGSVYFLYCPFGGDRLRAFLDALEPIARARPIRIGCVDLPLPTLPWLTVLSPPSADLVVYRSTLPERG